MSDIFWNIGLYYLIATGIATAFVLLWGWRHARQERMRQQWVCGPRVASITIRKVL
jgi:hypothetical protein